MLPQEQAIRRYRPPSERDLTDSFSPQTFPPKSWNLPTAMPAAWGSTNVETQVVDGEAIDMRRRLRCRHLACGADLFSGPAEGPAWDAASLEASGPNRRDCLLYGGCQPILFSSRVDHSPSRQSAPPVPGQPGPFSLGGEGVCVMALCGQAFRNVQERRIPAPLKMKSAADCVRFEKESFGALAYDVAGLDHSR